MHFGSTGGGGSRACEASGGTQCRDCAEGGPNSRVPVCGKKSRGSSLSDHGCLCCQVQLWIFIQNDINSIPTNINLYTHTYSYVKIAFNSMYVYIM